MFDQSLLVDDHPDWAASIIITELRVFLLELIDVWLVVEPRRNVCFFFNLKLILWMYLHSSVDVHMGTRINRSVSGCYHKCLRWKLINRFDSLCIINHRYVDKSNGKVRTRKKHDF